MSTKQLTFGGVICAFASICVIVSSLFHLISPLAVSCALYCLCAARSGKATSLIVIFTSNVIGLLIGGIGGGEILFSALLFSPFAVIIFCTAKFKAKPWQYLLRALLFAAFSALVYTLFATVLKDYAGLNTGKIGEYAFGAIFIVVMTLFGFVLDGFTSLILRRFHD